MKVLWTEPAVNDLEAIRDYIARDSELYAASFIEKILFSVDNLVDLPDIGRKVPEAYSSNIRELIFQKYRIVYRIHQDTVQIIAVVHGSRDLSGASVKPWEII